jgi:lysyl-tRNA synthetase class 2
LAQALRQQGIEPPADLDERELLDLAFSTVVAPGFEPAMLTFVYDFPVSHAALARIKRQAPPVAARFEAFCSGVELANGFAELTDAAEQRQRFEAELEQRGRRGRHAPPLDEELLTALEQGLPPCAGVALGVDRIVALAAGLGGVAEAMSFAHGSSEGGAD